jgi:hypothetical protein
MTPPQRIRILLEHIRDKNANSNTQTFLDFLRSALPDEEAEPHSELKQIFSTIQQLEKDVALRMLPGHDKNLCEVLLSDVSSILSISRLMKPAQRSILDSRTNIKYMLMTLSMIDRIYCESVKAEIDLQQVEEVIDRLATQIANTESLPDDERSLVSSCLELVRRATSKAKKGDVSSFQDDVLCAVGRLELSLKDNSRSQKAKDLLQDCTDGLLKIAGLVEIGGQAAGLISFMSPMLLGYES